MLDIKPEERVLDKGFLRLVDHLGDDSSVIQAARVSIGKGLTNEKRDKALIDYLMENRHMSPFEHVIFKFHVKCPIFVARQWIRHKNFSYNELSRRYTHENVELHLPEHLRLQDNSKNLQGSKFGEITNESDLIKLIEESGQKDCQLYQYLIDQGIANEVAREVLPLSLYTQYYATGNMRNWFHFLSLRNTEHAQYEIRQYAIKIDENIQKIAPWSYEAFKKYGLKDD